MRTPNEEEVIDDVNRIQAQIPNLVRQEPLSLITTVEKLIGENFGIWKFQMNVMLCARKFLNMVDGSLL